MFGFLLIRGQIKDKTSRQSITQDEIGRCLLLADEGERICEISPPQFTSALPCLSHPTFFTFFFTDFPPLPSPLFPSPPFIDPSIILSPLATRASPAPACWGGGCLREVRIMPLIWVYARTLVPYPSPARRDTADLPECCVNTGGLATRAPHHKRRRRRTP